MQWRHTVWPDAKLVYTAVAKVANTSVKSALLRTFVDPSLKLANPHAADMPYVTVHPDRVDAEYPDFLHFAIARNPFDRMVSFWADKIAGEGMTDGMQQLGFSSSMEFAEAVRFACSLPDDDTDPHIRSQCFLLADARGRLRVDLLLRFERLDHDWEALRQIVRHQSGAQLPALPKRRVSEHRPSHDYFDEETRRLVADRYAQDFALLGYDPASPVPADQSGQDVVADALGRVCASDDESRRVLDLTAGAATRADTVESAGGVYIGRYPEAGIGQLARMSALLRGRLDSDFFDMLVADRDEQTNRPLVMKLIDNFTGSDRVALDAEGRPIVAPVG